MTDPSLRPDLSALFNPRGVAVVGASPGNVRIGAQAQAALEAAMRETGVRVVGPNCQGLMNLRERVIAELRGAALLGAYRGRPPSDTDALAALLATVSRIAHASRAEIAEIDLNPVIVGAVGKGAVVADALIVLKDRAGRST